MISSRVCLLSRVHHSGRRTPIAPMALEPGAADDDVPKDLLRLIADGEKRLALVLECGSSRLVTRASAG